MERESSQPPGEDSPSRSSLYENTNQDQTGGEEVPSTAESTDPLLPTQDQTHVKENLPYPLDIVVKKIHTVVSGGHVGAGGGHESSSDDGEDDVVGIGSGLQAKREINRELVRQGWRVVEKGE